MQQFMYLPLYTFVYWTNIRDIAAEQYRNRKGRQPTRKDVDELILEIYEKLHEISWADAGLLNLKFLSTKPNDM